MWCIDSLGEAFTILGILFEFAALSVLLVDIQNISQTIKETVVHVWEYQDPDTGKTHFVRNLGGDEFSEIMRTAKSKKWKISAFFLLVGGLLFQLMGVLAS